MESITTTNEENHNLSHAWDSRFWLADKREV